MAAVQDLRVDRIIMVRTSFDTRLKRAPDFNVIDGTLSIKRREGVDDVLIVPQWSEDLKGLAR